MMSRFKITHKALRKIIKEELLREEEGLSNDDMASMIKTLTAMAQFDKSKFEKIKGLIDRAGEKALEKAAKGEKPADEEGKAE
jgi:hypothetical protein